MLSFDLVLRGGFSCTWGGGEGEEGAKPKSMRVPWRVAGFVSIWRKVGPNDV